MALLCMPLFKLCNSLNGRWSMYTRMNNMFVEIVIVDAKELYLSKAFAKVVYNVI